MRLRTLVSFALVMLMMSVSLAARPWQDKSDPISGHWDASFEAMGTRTPFTLDLKLDGNKVTGKGESAHTGPGTISNGSWDENKLSFTLNFAAHESIAVTGSLKDGKLTGEFRTEGFVSNWEAKKK